MKCDAIGRLLHIAVMLQLSSFSRAPARPGDKDARAMESRETHVGPAPMMRMSTFFWAMVGCKDRVVWMCV